MDRRRGHYPRQEYVPPGTINFGEIDFGHDVVAQQMPQILQNYQQRWDAADAAEAGLLEQQGATRMTAADRASVEGLVGEKLEDIDRVTRDKYGGDRGAASGDIVKRLSSANALVRQAEQGYQAYDEARKLYTQGIMSGNINRRYNPETNQMEIIPFEKLVGDGSHFQDGQFTGIPDYTSSFRGAGSDKWFQNAILNPIMNQTTQGFPFNISDGRWASRIKQGMSADDFRDLMDSEEGKAITESFLTNSPFASEEFENFEDARRYLTETGAASMRESGKLQLGNQSQPGPSPPSPGTGRSHAFVNPGEVDSEIAGKVKAATKTYEAVERTEQNESLLSDITNFSIGGWKAEGRQAYEGEPIIEGVDVSRFKRELSTDVQTRAEEGQATISDLAAILDVGITNKLVDAMQAVEDLGGKVADMFAQGAMGEVRQEEISKVLGAPNAGMPIARAEQVTEMDPESPQYEYRSELLRILWNQDKAEEFGLIKDANGYITFEMPTTHTLRVRNAVNLNNKVRAAEVELADIFNEGIPKIQKELEEDREQMVSYMEEFPFVELLVNQKLPGALENVPEDQHSAVYLDVVREAVGTMMQNQTSMASFHHTSKPLYTDSKDESRLHGRVYDMLANPKRTPVVGKIEVRKRKSETGDTSETKVHPQEFQEALIEAGKIDYLAITPGSHTLEVRVAGEYYDIDLLENKGFFPTAMIPEVAKVSNFLERGVNFDFGEAGNEAPELHLAGYYFQYEYPTDGSTPFIKAFDPQTGDPLSNGGGVFMDVYSTYLVESLKQ